MTLQRSILSVFISVVLINGAFSQTTGKIAGSITEQATGQPMPGANVLIEGTAMGAVTDESGRFFIINIAPGQYRASARMIGYGTVTMSNVRVSVNTTTTLDFRLQTQAIEGEAVLVTADAMATKKDQTSSVRTMSTEELKLLPIENVNQAVNLQAGVVQGHFRGGRDTEVTYLIDGLTVNNAFGGNSKSTEVDVEVVQELEVITGTFNAEYGKAMSGIVNAVTKDGSDRFHLSLSGSAANYFTPNDRVFTGLGGSGFMSRNLSRDYKFQAEGPILKGRLSYIANYRFQDNNGYLNGIRLFNPTDYTETLTADRTGWHTESSGDGGLKSMDTEKFHNGFGKLTFQATGGLKLGALLSWNDRVNTYYSHAWKYNPDSRKRYFNRSLMTALTANHMLSKKMYYDLKLSYNRQVLENYLYENPVDSRYLSPYYQGRGNSGFVTGGDAGPGRPTDAFSNMNAKFDVYWQVNRSHALKTGFLATLHEINRDRIDVRNIFEGTAEETEQSVGWGGKIDYPNYQLEIIPKTDETLDVYKVNPVEFAGYLQDKMEFDDLVINLGLRYDYFDPDQVYPTDRRNPGNQLSLPDTMMSRYPKAPSKDQISPRFGLAYQLGNTAVLRFSYGHFFQMPPMHALYQNNVFRVPTNDYGITMGNTLLDAQKTVTYEIGLWQELSQGMSLELALYYKDIYNLLSTVIVSTYNQIEYGLFSNKDYGNARGMEIKWKYQTGPVFTQLNYTLSYTKGNADNPWQTFNRAGDSRDPIKRYIPMSWDQRHTLNVTAGVSAKSAGATMTAYFNSGTPYTFSPMGYSELSLINLYENNDIKPNTFTVDLTAYWRLPFLSALDARLLLSVYNLFDGLNAAWVYGDTGKPYSRIVTDVEKSNFKSTFTDVYDQYRNPTCYLPPRQVKLGIQVNF